MIIMSRLYDYIEEYTPLLMEKVNKSEIDAMLNNNEIYVGAEYEFIARDINNPRLEALFDAATQDWRNYVAELESWQEERDEWQVEYNELETRIDDLTDEIAEEEDELERLEYLNYEEDEDLRNNLEKKIEKLENGLKKAEKELERHERDEPDNPEMGDDYISYMEEVGWFSHGQSVDPYDGEPDYPPDPSEDSGDMDDEAVENWMEEVSPKPPFKNWISGGTVSMGEKNWVVKSDSSLSPGGIEIISPPMPMKAFVKMCPKMFKWISDVGETDSSCGFHIHMSLKNTPDLKKVIDISKLIMFTDEQYIYKFFPDRERNTYVISVKKAMNKESKLIDKGTLNIQPNLYSQHYNAINWQGLSDDHGHIEFRYLGSSNYNFKWEKIKVVIAQYAYNLNLACNPDFKWQDYRTKLSRLMNMLEDREVQKLVNALNMFSKAPTALDFNTKKSKAYLDKTIKDISNGRVAGVDWSKYSEISKYYKSVLDKWKSFTSAGTKEEFVRIKDEINANLGYLS